MREPAYCMRSPHTVCGARILYAVRASWFVSQMCRVRIQYAVIFEVYWCIITLFRLCYYLFRQHGAYTRLSPQYPRGVSWTLVPVYARHLQCAVRTIDMSYVIGTYILHSPSAVTCHLLESCCYSWIWISRIFIPDSDISLDIRSAICNLGH